MTSELKNKLATLPKTYGCYRMKDKDGNIIYVGKAINLFNRVNSYFRGAHDFKTTKLVSNIVDFDFIIAKNEKDALILEQGLIKEYKPIFNIQFMDDKTYPYIAISKDKYFKVSIKRFKNKFNSNYELFGPYPDATSAKRVVELINRIYPLRKCEKLKKSVCLYYHLHECLGYCENKINQEELDEMYASIKNILSGNTKSLIKEYELKRDEASANLNFEAALSYNSIINDLKYVALDTGSEFKTDTDFDVVNYFEDQGRLSLCILNIRSGRILNKKNYLENVYDFTDDEIISYLCQYYEANPIPKEIVIYDANVADTLKLFINTDIKYLSNGYRYQLLKQAKENAKEYFEHNVRMLENSNHYFENLKQQAFEIFNKEVRTIEMFDNSHLAGKDTVAGMVQFKDFKPNKDQYRRFKLEDSADDLKSMKEAIYRRYYRLLIDGKDMPDLLIVDGGDIQIEAAKEILNQLDLDITLFGLAKNDKHNTANLIDRDLNIIELDPKSELFNFLSRLQDEVHRFAISYNRTIRNKKYTHSSLTKIKGIGPSLAKKLLDKFNSVENIKNAEIAELKTVLSENLAINVYNYFRGNDVRND